MHTATPQPSPAIIGNSSRHWQVPNCACCSADIIVNSPCQASGGGDGDTGGVCEEGGGTPGTAAGWERAEMHGEILITMEN